MRVMTSKLEESRRALRVGRIAAWTPWLCLIPAIALAAEPGAREIASFAAEEAFQAVAVDDEHFYAIANATLGKYELKSGRRVARWTADKDVPLKHLNSGVVVEGRLYCAHSNWPLTPRANSIEIWDAATLRHIESKPLDVADGAINWIDRHDGQWYGVFAHYLHGPDPAAPGHVSQTRLVKFDANWRPTQSWFFPMDVWKRFAPSSNSGGSFAADGVLYCTGHDRGELYLLRLPREGTMLEQVATIAAPIEGQGVAWRGTAEPQLFGIRRARREVVQMELNSP